MSVLEIYCRYGRTPLSQDGDASMYAIILRLITIAIINKFYNFQNICFRALCIMYVIMKFMAYFVLLIKPKISDDSQIFDSEIFKIYDIIGIPTFDALKIFPVFAKFVQNLSSIQCNTLTKWPKNSVTYKQYQVKFPK